MLENINIKTIIIIGDSMVYQIGLMGTHKRDNSKQCRPSSDAANAASDQGL